MSEVAFLGLGVMGYPMAGHLAARGGHRVVVYNRTAAKARSLGRRTRRRQRADPARGGGRARLRVRLRRQRRRPALGRPRARRRLRRHEAGRDLRRPHDRLRRRRARIARRGRAKLGLGFVDAPVSGGQAGAREWRADGHVRRRRGGLRQGRAGHRRLRQILPPDGRPRRGAIDQDGQPDLHRRAGAGPRRGPAFRRTRRARPPARRSTSSRRARRNPGRWTIATRR